MTNKFIKARILLVGVAFMVFLAIIVARAVHLQIYCSPWLSQKASNEYKKSQQTVGKRGTIYDRNLVEMAVSIDVISIAANPSQIKDIAGTSKALAKVLHITPRKIKRQLASNKSFVWLKRQTTPKETKAVRDLKLAGIEFVPEYNRFYPNTSLAAQTLGFTGLDGNGLEGIEYLYDQHLSGANSNFTIIKDALGNGFNVAEQKSHSNSGHNLILTIDRNIQFIAENALREAVGQFSAKAGTAIVMSPKTGAVMAIAHYPFFNPNSYSNFNRRRWRNRAVTDAFEPGSTMKIFSAAAAIESGNIKPDSIFYCENGAYKIGKNVVHDLDRYGWLTLKKIIKFSSNIGAVKISEQLGPERLYQILSRFGFGEKTGIDSPGETPGSLPHYERWSNIDLGAISFGHGISVSAIQLITAVSAIANDGILMKPYIVQKIADQNGKPIMTFEPRRIRRAISTETAKIIRDIMNSVVAEGGTGVSAALEGYRVCGKTGTARKLDKNGEYSDSKHLASFVGFTPAESPQVAILVIIDEPQGKYYGGIVAAPVFKEIAHETLNYLNIPPQSITNKFKVALGAEDRG